MNNTEYPQLDTRTQMRRVALLCSALFGTLAFAQDDESVEEIFELSPFEVALTDDGSYHVSDTLAGNRLRTDMKDIGAALTHVSKDFLDDMGVSNIMDIADLLPSVTAVTTEEGGSTDVNGAWRDQRFRIRGIFTEFASRNYHSQSSGTMLGSDGYNADRMTVSAGANSILFGAANPAGVINTSTLKAMTGRDFSKLVYRTDKYGTQRFEFHHNESMLDDRVALRVALLEEKGERFPEPSFRDQERYYLAGKWKITDKTILTGNIEYADIVRNAPIWGNYRNNAGAWEDAGENPIVFDGTRSTGNFDDDGIWYTSNAPFQQLVFGEDGLGDTSTFTLAGDDWRNRPRSAPNEVTVVGFTREPMDPAITGGRNFSINQRINSNTGTIGDIAIEHKFTDNFYMQLAYFYADREEDVWTAWNAQSLIRDAASTLRDGVTGNPNYGGYYVDIGVPQLRDSTFENRGLRVTATYDLDLQERSNLLGRHQFAAMFEDREGTRETNRAQLFNTGSSRNNQNNYLNGQNKLRAIVFVDPTTTNNADPDLRDLAGYFNTFSDTGMNAEWKNFRAGTSEENYQKSSLLAVQSKFMEGRLVTTLGYREDKQDFYTLVDGWERDEMNFFVPYQDITNAPQLVEDVSGEWVDTYSLGGVFHMIENKGDIDHISLTYNTSTNFQPSQGFLTFDGSVRGNSSGETEDIGIKVGLFERKLNASLNFFESAQLNARGKNVGQMTNTWNGIWEDLEEETGDLSFLNNLVPEQSSNGDTFDVAAEGIEFQLSYNPIPNWRIAFMASRNETINTNVLPATQAFIAENWPALRAAYGDFIPSDGGTRTVNDRLDDAFADLQVLFAEEGISPLQQRRDKFSLNTNYRFTERLKGWSVGGFFQWRDKPGIGYARDETGTPIPEERFYGDSQLTTGLNIGYTTNLRDGKVTWSNQLNIRNVFDDTDVQPIRADETSFMSKTPYIWNYRYTEPRSFVYTSTLSF